LVGTRIDRTDLGHRQGGIGDAVTTHAICGRCVTASACTAVTTQHLSTGVDTNIGAGVYQDPCAAIATLAAVTIK